MIVNRVLNGESIQRFQFRDELNSFGIYDSMMMDAAVNPKTGCKQFLKRTAA